MRHELSRYLGFIKIRLVGAELFPVYRRTDMTKLIVAFSSVAYTPKNR
jgi:hypothetical protein